jgi:hypothetical protein
MLLRMAWPGGHQPHTVTKISPGLPASGQGCHVNSAAVVIRSRLHGRFVAEVYHAGAERFGAGQRESYLAVRFAEQALAAADYGREDEQVQLRSFARSFPC